MAAPMDLGVTYSEDKKAFLKTVETVFKLGYNTICINYVVENLNVKTSNKKGKEKPLVLKEPKDIFLDEETLQSISNKLMVGSAPLRQVSRITLVITSSDQINRMQKDEIIKQYDVIAIKPTTEQLFHTACEQLPVDIISFDQTSSSLFRLKRKIIGTAIERGIHFELDYTSLSRGSDTRKSTINMASSLVRLCKGKNIIFTSASRFPIEIRGPRDVANLGLLYGMKEHEAKAAVSKNCLKVLLHAKGRKHTNACTVALNKVADFSEKERAIIMGEQSTQNTQSNGKRKGDKDNEEDSPPNKQLKSQTPEGGIKRSGSEDSNMKSKKHKKLKTNA